MDELSVVEQFMTGLLAKLEPASRKKAMLDIGRALRRSQQKRIAAQKNPDGSTYDARKPRIQHSGKARDKRGRIKRGAMFAKLRTARFMRLEADANGLAIGFAGNVSRVASVHQFGETDSVAPGGKEYKYPARVLLGITPEERELIRDMLLKHIAK
jgi:phage virion morphogenesis protein